MLDASDELLKRLIDEEYTKHPIYGSREMVVYLKRCEHRVNRKRAQRLMRLMRLMRCMGLAGMAPGPNTSRAHPQHKGYPYLLRGVPLVRVNHVLSTDITYSRLKAGFAYLMAIIGWYSRRVLTWMGEQERSITSLLNACDAVSSMRTYTLTAMGQWESCSLG